MERKSFLTTIIFVYFIASTVGLKANQTEIFGLAKLRKNEVHVLSSFWPLQSVTGVVGSVLNIFVLYIFISDRQTLTTSINLMIWSVSRVEVDNTSDLLFMMDTLFRLLYSSLALHWRSYLMYYRTSLLHQLISFETVRGGRGKYIGHFITVMSRSVC